MFGTFWQMDIANEIWILLVYWHIYLFVFLLQELSPPWCVSIKKMSHTKCKFSVAPNPWAGVWESVSPWSTLSCALELGSFFIHPSLDTLTVIVDCSGVFSFSWSSASPLPSPLKSLGRCRPRWGLTAPHLKEYAESGSLTILHISISGCFCCFDSAYISHK